MLSSIYLSVSLRALVLYNVPELNIAPISLFWEGMIILEHKALEEEKNDSAFPKFIWLQFSLFMEYLLQSCKTSILHHVL